MARERAALLESPPHTIKTLPTIAHRWPTRGVGISPSVCSNVAEIDNNEEVWLEGGKGGAVTDIMYKSLRIWPPTSPPKMNNSPVGVAMTGEAAPNRGNGDGDGYAGGRTPGWGKTMGGWRSSGRCDHG